MRTWLAIVLALTTNIVDEPLPPFRYLSIVLFLSITFSVQAAEETDSSVVQSIRQSEQIELYLKQITELETEFGPLDRSLIEPLNILSELYTETGNLVEANTILSRQSQLLRVTEGPDTFSQVPVIEDQIINNVRMNDLEAATNNFENIQ